MKRYIIRKGPRPRAWQVIAANKARAIESVTDVSEAEREQMFNRATTVTLPSRRAAVAFVTKIGGTIE